MAHTEHSTVDKVFFKKQNVAIHKKFKASGTTYLDIWYAIANVKIQRLKIFNSFR